MPRSDWRRYDQIVIALGTVAIGCLLLFVTWELSATNATYTHDADQAAQSYAESTQARISRTCTDREVVAFTKCVSEEVKAEQEAQTAQYDLAAQNRMALWALWSLIISTFSLLATGVGIYFVWKSLGAAYEAIASEREIGEAQVCAYLAPHEPEIAFDNLRPVVRIKFTNTGNSPALWLTGECQIIFGPGNIDGCAECRPTRIFIGSLAAGESTRDVVFECEAPLSIHQTSRKNRMSLDVLIDLEWQNVFNQDDGCFCSYLVRVLNPLDKERAVSLSPQGMSLGRRPRVPINKYAGATYFAENNERPDQPIAT